MGLRLDRDAGAIVGYGDAHLGVTLFECDCYFTVGRHVLQRVIDQIQQHAAQQVFIAAEWRFDRCRHLDAGVRPRQHASAPGNVLHQLIKIEADDAQRILAGIGACERQHVVDDARQAPRLVFDDAQRVAVFGFITVRLFQSTPTAVRAVAIGVRSSCDASAVNCRCLANDSSRRCSRSLKDCASPPSSSFGLAIGSALRAPERDEARCLTSRDRQQTVARNYHPPNPATTTAIGTTYHRIFAKDSSSSSIGSSD